jgi:hypothetical protein
MIAIPNRVFHFPSIKYQADVTDYQIDWSQFIGTDSITSQTTVVTNGVLVSSGIVSNNKVSFRVSGGTDDTDLVINQTVNLATGQVFTAKAFIKVLA